MPSMKALRRRITSVDTTKKIMRAMDMVAAARLHKIRGQLAAARPFAEEAGKVLAAFAGLEEAQESVFFKPREVGSTAFLVIASDKGLCGSYNTNVAEKALERIDASGDSKIIAVGYKGHEYFKRRGKNILRTYPNGNETLLYAEAERIAGSLLALYTNGEADEVYAAYTQFRSALVHVPLVVKLLPAGDWSGAEANESEMKYDPDMHAFIRHAIPMCLSAFVYVALLESDACEQAARIVSMESAVDNASEIIDKLTHTYNRSRQAAITQELSEIISNANMLK